MHLFGLADSPATGLDNTSYAGTANVPTIPTAGDYYPATAYQSAPVSGSPSVFGTILGIPTPTLLLIVAALTVIYLMRKN